ncbi:BTAD domain-containing putative transcriptional regulator [Streptomyces sp. AP-93]|uniref:AfsR/SARP family transcriptional regulator n=1 Tax=Streptomyces sp. AP-93 TaxID=2929048 RepID=UPI001FAFBA32|nr:BTAD domain-containing putative transcriptional regulator [Streptomyces sp. AP-93]MCJ0874244.1 SARP family transcriptional regulator [Streptomyces sp. AP-93]
MNPQFLESPVRIPRQVDAPVLHLLGGPRVLHRGRWLDVPEGSKRLLAFVALNGGRVERRHAAGTLWPAGDDQRAAGNLRSALWRLKAAGIDLLDSDKCSLSVREHTVIDLYVLYGWAGRLIAGTATAEDLSALKWRTDALDLLPGWYDDWVLLERERVRQRLLHALEALSRELARVGRHAEAVESALVAVAAEPLRESAQRALIEAHLAEGNLVEAKRSYNAYRGLTRRELGVGPGRELSALMDRVCKSLTYSSSS